jgi:hypothetical protein
MFVYNKKDGSLIKVISFDKDFDVVEVAELEREWIQSYFVSVSVFLSSSEDRQGKGFTINDLMNKFRRS